MVTHDLNSLYSVCDRIAVLAEGKIVADGPISTMLCSEHPWVKSYFRGQRGHADLPQVRNGPATKSAAIRIGARRYVDCGEAALQSFRVGMAAPAEGALREVIFYLTGGVLAASLVLGGGTRSGFLGDVVLQLLSIPLLWAVLRELITSGAYQRLKWPLAFAATIALVPAAQLIPLPTPIWRLLPGREVLSETYRLLGPSQPLLPLTMSPTATRLSGLAILPPIAIFLGSLTLNYAHRRRMSVVIIVLSVISVFLGLLQLAQGPNSALRFFDFTDRTEAVGSFANGDHFVAPLYSATLFAAVWLVDATIETGLQPRRKVIESAAILLFAASFVALLVSAQMMTRSRAGLGLSIVALFAAIAIGVLDRRTSASSAGSAKFTIGLAAVAITVSMQFALYRILERFGPDALSDARVPFARNRIAAAKAYMPFGSGLGTFVPVYQMFEKPSDVAVAYANHAHNDLLEVWLETGASSVHSY